MRGAVMKAFYNLDLSPSFSCPSSCEWEGIYTTLGFGYSCQSVTETTLATKACIYENENGGSNCSMRTPNGVVLNTSYIPTQQQTINYISSNISTGWDPTKWYWIDRTTPQTEFVHIAQYLAETNDVGLDDFATNVTECSIRLTTWDMSGVSAQGNAFTIGNRTEVPLAGLVMQPANTGFAWNRNVTATRAGNTFSINLYDWMAITSFIITQLADVEDKISEVDA
jgi:hypothetical protein